MAPWLHACCIIKRKSSWVVYVNGQYHRYGWAKPCNAEKHATIIQSCVLDARLCSILAHLTILASFNHLFNPSVTPDHGQSVSQLVRSLHAMYAFDFSFERSDPPIYSSVFFFLFFFFKKFIFLLNYALFMYFTYWIYTYNIY